MGSQRPMLQWGRVRLNAETRRANLAIFRLEQASMGPRSVERGNRRENRNEVDRTNGFNGAAFG